jgi:hypothetical protein
VLRTANKMLRFAPLLLVLVTAVVVAPLAYAVNCEFSCKQAMTIPVSQCTYSMLTPNAVVPASVSPNPTSLLGAAPSAPPVVAPIVAVATLPDTFAPESPPIDPLGAVIRI